MWPFGTSHSYDGHVTPSTTSVSDGEDAEGEDLNLSLTDEQIKDWVGKGKGKGRGDGDMIMDGSGLAGSLPPETLVQVSTVGGCWYELIRTDLSATPGYVRSPIRPPRLADMVSLCLFPPVAQAKHHQDASTRLAQKYPRGQGDASALRDLNPETQSHKQQYRGMAHRRSARTVPSLLAG